MIRISPIKVLHLLLIAALMVSLFNFSVVRVNGAEYENDEGNGFSEAIVEEIDTAEVSDAVEEMKEITETEQGTNEGLNENGYMRGEADNESKVVDYPAPEGIAAHEYYEVNANSQSVFVYETEVGLSRQKAGFAYFDFSGTVAVEVHTGGEIESATIRPLSLGITPEIDGKILRFTLNRPVNLSIEVNGNTGTNLHLFTNPIETDIPDPEDSGVIYFGPGIHELSDTLFVPSNTTVYIAGGAIVRGRIHTDNAHNVKIRGRGIVDGSTVNREDFGGEAGSFFMRLWRSSNIEVNGIILHNSPHWTLVPIESEKVNIHNVRLIGQRRSNNDGMDIVDSRNVLIDNVFIRTIDDAIALKAKYIGGERNQTTDVTIQNSTIWNEDAGNALEIGFETLTDQMKNLTFRNIDIIHNNDGSALSIHNGDSADIHNVVYDDIRIESAGGKSYNFINMYIQNTFYSTGDERGEINNVVINNIRSIEPLKPSNITGLNAENSIRDLRIHQLIANGSLLSTLGEAQINVGSHAHNVTLSTAAAEFEPSSDTVLEENQLTVSLSPGGTVKEEIHAAASGGAYSNVILDDEQGSASFLFETSRSAHQHMKVNIRKSATGGMFRPLVDGVSLPVLIDSYSETSEWQEVDLGTKYLTAGSHELTFEAIGRHASSGGIELGVDYIGLSIPTETTREAEDTAASASGGHKLSVERDGLASGGYYLRGNTSEAGDWVEFSIPVHKKQTVPVTARLQFGPNMGIVQVSIDGEAQGEYVDAYRAETSFGRVDLGTASLEPGDYTVRFTVVGKHEHSSGYGIGIDYIRFGQLPETVVWKGVRIAPTQIAGVVSTVTDGYRNSTLAKPGDWVSYNIYVPFDGYYTIIPTLHANNQRGSYQLTIDDEPHGGFIDAYDATARRKEFNLGAVYLTEGYHYYRFTATGKHEASSGFSIGMDSIKLVPDVAIEPIADVDIFASSKDRNMAGAVDFGVKSDGNMYSRKAYLKFDYSSWNGTKLNGAKLRLYVNRVNADPVRTITVYGMEDLTWKENEVTWNNAPDPGIRIESVELNNVSGKWVEIDVSDYMKSIFPQRLVGFHLVNEGPARSQGDINFNSRENDLYRPQLVIDGEGVTIPVTGIMLSHQEITLWPNNQRQLTATIEPLLGSNRQVEWTTSDASIAVVDSEGVVTGVSTGTAIIKATTTDGGFTAEVTVHVAEQTAPYEKVLPATADSYVWENTKDTNYGTEQEIVVKSDRFPGNRRSYIKFDINTFGGEQVEEAVLRLYSSSVDTDPSRTISIYGNNPFEWTETGITWNNQPADGQKINEMVVSTSERWYEVDVTDYVNGQINKGLVSFKLINEGEPREKGLARFASRESGARGPQLMIKAAAPDPGGPNIPSNNARLHMVTVNGMDLSEFDPEKLEYRLEVAYGTNRAEVAVVLADEHAEYTISGDEALQAGDNRFTIRVTAADGVTIKEYIIFIHRQSPPERSYTIYPASDTYVSSANMTTNYGSSTSLSVTGSTDKKNAYLQFDLSGFTTATRVSSAKLRLYKTSVGTDATRTLNINSISDDSWTESGITWSNAPQSGRILQGLSVDNQSNKWYEIDVTGYVNENLADKKATFIITSPSTSSQSFVNFSSKESGINSPVLILESDPVTIPYSSDKFDIYLLIGQSNMTGSGLVNEIELAEIPRTYLLNEQPGGGWDKAASPLNKYSSVKYQNDGNLSPGNYFAKTMTQNNPDIGIGLVSNARSGSSIEQWAKNAPIITVDGYPASNNLYTEAINRTTNAMKYGNLKGILWLQGEANINDTAYLSKLTTLINNFRTDFAIPDLPFVVSQIYNYNHNADYINSVFQNLPATVPYTDYVSSDGTSTVGDNVHFDAASQMVIGSRFAQKIIKLENLSHQEITLWPNNQRQLTATIEPLLGSNRQVEWTTSDASIAVVDSEGVVTGVSTGTAIIKATTTDGGFTAEVTVHVAEQTAPYEKVLPATADSYVWENTKDTNYGTEQEIVVKSDRFPGNRRSYIKFDINTFGGEQVEEAVLRLYSSSVDTDPSRTISIYGNNPFEWTETGITWNNQPADGQKINEMVVSTSERWYEVDVTDYVNGQINKGLVSFKLINEGEPREKGLARFASRESGARGPQLMIKAAAPDPGGPNIPSNNARLHMVTVNGMDLSEFDPEKLEYRLEVAYGTNRAEVAVVLADEHAEYTISGDEALQSGDNRFTIRVIAADGVTIKEYIIIIHRPSPPEWSYTDQVSNIPDKKAVNCTQAASCDVVFLAGQGGDVQVNEWLDIEVRQKHGTAGWRLHVRELNDREEHHVPSNLGKKRVSPIFELSASYLHEMLPVNPDVFLSFNYGRLPGKYTGLTVWKLDPATQTWVQVEVMVEESGRLVVRSQGSGMYALFETGTLTEGSASTINFTDLNGHWAQQLVQQAVQSGIIVGYTDGTFRPEQIVSREEFAVMMMRAFKIPPTASPLQILDQFTDKSDLSDWSKARVATAIELGWVSGFGDGTIRPKAEISRVQAVTMLVRAIEAIQHNEQQDMLTLFVDGTEIPQWATEAMQTAVSQGWVKGDGKGKLHPLRTATRAEAVALILQLQQQQS